jgi:hypothetical protein
MKSLTASVLLLSVLLLGFPKRAQALYIDPSTGSIMLQVLVGGLLAIAATTRFYWNRIRSVFKRERKS